MSGLVEDLKEFIGEARPDCKKAKDKRRAPVRPKIMKTGEKDYPYAFFIADGGLVSADSIATLLKTIAEFPAELMHDWLAKHGYWLDPKGWYGKMPPGYKDVTRINSKKEAAEVLMALGPDIAKYVIRSGPMLGYNLLFDTLGKTIEVMSSGQVYNPATGDYSMDKAIEFGELPKKAEEIASMDPSQRKAFYDYIDYISKVGTNIRDNPALTSLEGFTDLNRQIASRADKDPVEIITLLRPIRNIVKTGVDLNEANLEVESEVNDLYKPPDNNLFYESLDKKYPEESIRATGMSGPNLAQLNVDKERQIANREDFKPIGHLHRDTTAYSNYGPGLDMIGGTGFTDSLFNDGRILKRDLVSVIAAITKRKKTELNKMKVDELRKMAKSLISR